MVKILIIEDNFEIRENTVELLQIEGFETVEADNGLSGLELAMKELPDIILCDIMMPGLNGYEVFQGLRKESITASIPFIFLTANAEKKDAEAGMDMGASAYINKPFEVDELLKEIRRCLGK